MAQQASVALITARTLLNDDAAELWTDPKLLPKLQQAHRELQVALRSAGAPVMKTSFSTLIAALGTDFPVPTDIVEPIRLWEKDPSDADSLYVEMTEYNPLPFVDPTTRLIYWQWIQEKILFIGATANRIVRLDYTRNLPVPTAATDSLNFINAELYLGPRTAAIAAGSAGQKDMMTWATQLAETCLGEVILANRGRAKPSQGSATRP